MEKKEFIKVQLFYGDKPQNWYVMPAEGFTLPDDVSELAVGDSYKLTKVEMTEAEFEALGDFEGF